MAVKSTIFKAEIEISDIDRNYYATHQLTLAQHPSENDRRLMARLMTFVLFAHERLEFGRGLSNDDDPDLWIRDLTGNIEQWIELGQPDESSVRKACGRAQQVILVTYIENSADVWWNKNASALSRCKNLSVLDLPTTSVDQATQLLDRSMRVQAVIQEGECQLGNQSQTIFFKPRYRLSPDSAR